MKDKIKINIKSNILPFQHMKFCYFINRIEHYQNKLVKFNK